MAAEEIEVIVINEGAPGVGLPAGGSTGQVATKASGTDYDVAWETPGASAGDVVGPASAVDSRPALFDGVTGKLLKQASAALGTAAFQATGAFDPAGSAAEAQAAAIAASQPVDADLTAIAALSTTAFGRAVLELANAGALATAAGLGTGDSPTFTGVTLSGGTMTGGTSGVTVTAGGSNQNITLTPSGTGGVSFPVGALATPSVFFAGSRTTGFWGQASNRVGLSVNGSLLSLWVGDVQRNSNLYVLGWSSGSPSSAAENAGISYVNAAHLALGNGAQGNASGTLSLAVLNASSYVKVTPVVVASLVAAATAGAGARTFVTDANATLAAGIGTTVAAGGANFVPVHSNGTNWIIG